MTAANLCNRARRTTAELNAAVAGERGIFVLQRIGDLVGYIDVRSVYIEGAAEFASFNLAIRTRWQGRGLGASLVKSAEEWVRRRGLLFLIFHVASSSSACHPLEACRPADWSPFALLLIASPFSEADTCP
ncbi:GNAT family N-acetyltransferase [Sphingobium baderi]|uniref:GNAT family N-acetyltransferase n=1 Tax=Sphingobium baderi TaxID=1332080 RepID=UPI0009EB745A